MAHPFCKPPGLNTRRAATHGLTLVEMIIVIGISGVLITLLVPALQAAMVMAKVTQAESDLRLISIALHQYYLRYQVMPPARKYCLTEKRDQFLALPQELLKEKLLDVFPPDAFDAGRTYRYTAIGPGFINDSPITIKFVLPQAFPQVGGALVKYTQPDRCPVKCIVWSVGPAGTPDFEILLGFNPVDPANWYPANPRGIVCRYFTGKDWYSVP